MTERKTRTKTRPAETKGGCEIPRILLERMGFLLSRLFFNLREDLEKALKPKGLTGKHWGILLVLQEKGSLAQQEIGKCIHIDRSTMVQIIDDLERKGLAERKAHPTDRRAHSVYLTAKGRDLLPLIHRLGLRAEKDFLAPLSAPDQRDLYRILRQLVSCRFSGGKRQ
jgi:DNA-binding MarR family transcriptional regulator